MLGQNKSYTTSSAGAMWFNCGSDVNSTSSIKYTFCSFTPGTPGTYSMVTGSINLI
jgi:hypothetical protein